MSDSLDYLSEMITVDTSIPVTTIIACALGEIVLALLIGLMLISTIGKNSPLALIQAQVVKQRKRDARKSKKKESHNIFLFAAF